MIPDDAVTAAAKVIYADNISNHAGDNAAKIIEACERVARKVLEAAAPHLMAASWDESAMANDCPNCNNKPAVNPYRKPTHAV